MDQTSNTRDRQRQLSANVVPGKRKRTADKVNKQLFNSIFFQAITDHNVSYPKSLSRESKEICKGKKNVLQVHPLLTDRVLP